MSTTLSTVIVDTHDLEAMADFYQRGLALPDPLRMPGHVGFDLGSVYFGFDEVAREVRPGPVAPWFEVDDLEATYARFLELGAPSQMEPTDKPWGARLAAVTDPDGNRVGLSQRR